MLANTHTNHRAQLLALTFAVTTVLIACGSVAGSQGSLERARIIRDPDNPAYTGLGIDTESMWIIRDPDNPYWSGSTASEGAIYEAAGPGHGPR